MTVLVVSHMFPNEVDQGAGIFVLEQIRALRKAGMNVLVVSPSPWAPHFLRFIPGVRKYLPIPRRSVVDGFAVEHPRVPTLPKKHGFAFSGIAYYLSCRRLLRKLSRQTRIDVIHAHTLLPDGFAAVLLGREFSLPVVCTAHGSDVNVYPFTNRFVHWATRWALRQLDEVITVSDNLRQQAIQVGGLRLITVAHNGADHGSFKPLPQSEARRTLGLPGMGPVVCFVGYLREEKAVEDLLNGFALLGRCDATLCLVGDGPLKERLVAQARSLGILDHCIFAGNRQHAEIPVWLSAADCLILCSLSEGLPTVLPEAMLCHVPVIATPVGGVPEIIREHQTGLLVPTKSPNAIANALHTLLSDCELSSTLATNAELCARTSLTWEANARRTIAVYEDAIVSHSLRHDSDGTLRRTPVRSIVN
jgi:teichuronic acid biosynthesis glycosyltransferase TuaC